MQQLTYKSKSKAGLSIQDLDNILSEAIVNNSKLNITGCLIFHEGSFIQIIEGAKKDIEYLFKLIKKDNRHHSVKLLCINKVKARYFERWNMAFYKPNEFYSKQFLNNLILLSEYSDKSTGSLLSFWNSVKIILTDMELKK